ncbi:glutamate receptor ionotropic, kainate 4-like [Gigantopelta aegis]|uniref:glutamate receptor ionotropic, kainate 4-like n=1 Tax=Gigantopelta aegis TaxID=1735272 RepID=UPI001B88954B|nr:glutamate receptor ionotropic, kainate 4-like [Gigantopelta aegis]
MKIHRTGFHKDKDNTLLSSFLLDVHQRIFPQLDFLLLTSDAIVWDVLSYVNRFDSLSNRTTDFNYHSKWLVLLKSENVDKSVNELDSLHNVVFVKAGCNFKTYNSYTEIMTLVHHSNSTVLQNVIYTHNVNNSILFPALKYGYNGRKLIVATLSASSLVHWKTVNNVTEYSGFCVYLLNSLAENLNFTYEFVEPTRGSWGVLVNGSWNGLVGMMERREADLALADLTINIDRSKVMHYLLPPIYYDYIDIIFKEENNMPSTWMTLLRPFCPIVFMWIAVCAASFFILYAAAVILFRKKCTHKNEPRTASDVFWFTISSLLKQGSRIDPTTHGARVLVSAWLLFVVIIVAEYTANLTAAFTVRPGLKPFESLRQLLDNPRYKIGIFPGGITSMILKVHL